MGLWLTHKKTYWFESPLRLIYDPIVSGQTMDLLNQKNLIYLEKNFRELSC